MLTPVGNALHSRPGCVILWGMQPYSLYLHIPFCRSRCTYCDFNTFARVEHLIPEYVAALRREIRYVAEAAGERLPVHTIFFGGGTPSLLKPGEYESILADLKAGFEFLPGMEISLEANPGTVTLQSLTELRRLGFNRISFGVQSFNPQDLTILGRIHSANEAFNAVLWSRKAGFENLSLDLIFGLPGQSLTRWQSTLELAIQLRTEHLSIYSLILEEGTLINAWMQRGLLEPVDDDLAADMYEWTEDRLEQAGFLQYEISNWARNRSLQCRHNLQYWRMEPYLGFGAGAHGYALGQRTANTGWIGDYIQHMRQLDWLQFPFSPANASRIPLSRQDEMGEFMMVGLRLVDEGVSQAAFEQRFSQKLGDVFQKPMEKLLRQGLLEWKQDDPDRLRLTRQGRILGNRVFMEFV